MGTSPSPKIVQFSSRDFTYANFTLPPGESSDSEERASAHAIPTRPLPRPTSPQGVEDGQVPKPENRAVFKPLFHLRQLHSPSGRVERQRGEGVRACNPHPAATASDLPAGR
ncbi:hypothetical protein Poly59_15290 [Rubripirellula reticaptiva]|uniref:Uncharacterized protein n=1 Tax=Rubripirellula reticaptiva TaxID=2528013 RepID=A0A5C6F1V5_9BACT|nr:hypothetical protein Poly59_15290 [Rubripirellula reticaptiva]